MTKRRYQTKFETLTPVAGLTINAGTRVQDGEECETSIIVHGRFMVAASDREEVNRQLAEIVERYAL